MGEPDVTRTIEAVWRIESPRLTAALTRIVRDVGVAEDLAQEAFVAALQQWQAGFPERPGAWLMATAKRRAIDRLRRESLHEQKTAEIVRELERTSPADPATAAEEFIADDLLRLIFTTCHPVLSSDARVALTLRLLGGLTTAEIARSYLVPEPTVAQRIGRAKKTLAAAQVPFELPDPHELPERLGSVLESIYLIFNEGYSPAASEAWVRVELLEEALRLGRILAGLLPNEPEVHGLVSLMELQASRTRARIGHDGEPVLLNDQDRGRWDHVLVARGLAALERAMALKAPLGPYALQAAIAACHARARTPEDTDWNQIVALYDALAEIMRSPVVELNRAVAVAMAFGPEAGLELVDALGDEPALRDYHLLPSVRGHLLEELGRTSEARHEFERAAGLTRNAKERDLLMRRAGSSVLGH